MFWPWGAFVGYFISKDADFNRECRELADAGPQAGTLKYKITFPSGAVYEGSGAQVISVKTMGGKNRGPDDNWFLPPLPEGDGLIVTVKQKAEFSQN